MAGKREKPEDIALKLRQVEVLHGQGKSVSEAVRRSLLRCRPITDGASNTVR